MLFSSISFVYFFLPVVITVNFLLPFKYRNNWLLISSLFFYIWGEPAFCILPISTICINFALSRLISEPSRTGRRVFAAAIALNLAPLLFFKYADFIIESVNAVIGLNIPLLGIPLPLGISFYTFQLLSYVFDVYRRDTQNVKTPFELATYIMFFPQLVAGPIVRYKTISNELKARKPGLEDISYGASRFVIGLSKKVLIANQIGELSEILAVNSVSFASTWVGVTAFSLQAYFDFSGYSDMAIGLGRIFGFHFLENFNYPFISKSVSEFWRRWHISLGTWFREYVYIPLGGSRVTALKWIRNLFAVWFCTGLWHGASLNFILWGLYFGVFLGLEKIALKKVIEKTPGAIRHIVTLFVIAVSFVIFMTESVPEIPQRLAAMFGLNGFGAVDGYVSYVLRSYAPLLFIAAIGSTPLPKFVFLRLRKSAPNILAALEPVCVMMMLVLCTAFLADSSYNPFLYFRF